MPLEITPQGETQLLVTRHFAAPPETVYTAHTDPDLVAKWMLGPPGWALTVEAYEATPGGKIHLVWNHDEEGELVLTGEFLALDPPRKTVHTEQFHMSEPMPPSTITTYFEPDGDGCRLRMIMDMPDADARAAALEMGMADGMEQSYARLDGVLAA